jgi:drug/metabolite transporter (DMT)-like permease
MLLLLISAFLVGVSTPLAALLVEDHDPLVFAFYFLTALLVIQIPFIFRKWDEIKALIGKKEFGLVVTGSLIATCQYWCEFSSLKVGLPVSHVAFLTLTVPTWVMFYEYVRGRGQFSSVNKVIIALIGSLALILPTVGDQFTPGHLLPILTSFFMAAFLITSKKSQEAGISPLVVSFFNDLLALIGISVLIIINGKTHLVVVPANASGIALYAAIIGLLPGLFFLYGLRSTKLITASTIIIIEPIIFGIVAITINFNEIGLNFILGAIAISVSSMPDSVFAMVRKARLVYVLNAFK